jgi:uncharacterized membrane protein YhiD involved in acid resistance
MSFSDIKDAFKSNAGLKTTFIVLLVATILTIYEISMFYFIITPTVAKQVDSGLDNVVDSIKRGISLYGLIENAGVTVGEFKEA